MNANKQPMSNSFSVRKFEIMILYIALMTITSGCTVAGFIIGDQMYEEDGEQRSAVTSGIYQNLKKETD